MRLKSRCFPNKLAYYEINEKKEDVPFLSSDIVLTGNS